MDSIWTKSVKLPKFPELQGNLTTDVLIIGGGIAGILCAYFLQEQRVDCALAENRTICSGITKNTTAKITSQHGLIYQKLIKSRGNEIASMYLKANQESVKNYARLAKEIDCDFEYKKSYVYSINHREKLEKEAEALERIGFSAQLLDDTELPFSVAGALCFENQAQFHPLKFLAEISKNLKIYEHTFVSELKPGIAVTEHGNIFFKKVIFTTHFPMNNKHGLYFLKLYQHRSYVIALENAPNVHGMYVDEADSGMSFRNHQNLLLIGGGGHRTGKQGGNWRELREFVKIYYGNATEAACWATQDCMSLDGVPYIGQYSKGLPNCYVAAGFNKWGITSSMTAAEILADLVLDRKNPYAEVFNPSRSLITPQLFINGWEATKNMLTISKKRCPHMGCALKWNAAERSWDCPCHGSRFEETGGVIDGPAEGDLKKQKDCMLK